MPPVLETDICILGSGPAAAQLALSARRLGLDVTMIAPEGGFAPERAARLKALVDATQSFAAAKALLDQGMATGRLNVDWLQVRRHCAQAGAAAAVADATERLSALGVCCLGPGCLVDPGQAQADGRLVRAKRFFIAANQTTPSPLDQVLAWENLPEALTIEGGSPMAAALAQALARLGVKVTVGTKSLLSGFDPELVEAVRQRWRQEGIGVGEEPPAGSPIFSIPEAKPALDGPGIEADGMGRTVNRRIWAIPQDFAGDPAALASWLIRRAILRLPTPPLPTLSVAFTDPGLAATGLDERTALARNIPFRLLRWAVADTELGRAQGRPPGLVKVLVDRRGRVLGASIAAAHAAELIVPWVLATAKRLPALALAGAVSPSPSVAEAGRMAGTSALVPLLLGDWPRRWARLMIKLA